MDGNLRKKLLNRPVYTELQRTTRQCYKCEQTLYFRDFVQTVSSHGEMEYFGFAFLEEIWRNPIFIIECCWCHAGIPSPAVLQLRHIERIMDEIKNEQKYNKRIRS